MNKEEIWKDIPGYETSHQVSSLGRVRTKTRMVNSGWGTMVEKQGVILNPSCDRGYFRVQFNNNGKIYGVHRLVCSAFLGLDLKNTKMFACHKDDNPSNNSVDNLFVGTAMDNVKDKIKKGRAVYARGTSQGSSKLTEQDIKDIFKLRSMGKTQIAIAKMKGVCQPHISDILNKNMWKHVID